jgi:hypothetical protein
MDSNMHSSGQPKGLDRLNAAVGELAGRDLNDLPDAALAEQVLQLHTLLERLHGHWLQGVAALDARGAAGAEHGLRAASTAGWLRSRLRLGATTAAGCVRTARALFRGPLARTGQALAEGEISAAHAAVLAGGTHDLPAHTAAEAEPVLLEAARRLDPPRLRRVITHLRWVADPDAADQQAQRQHAQRGIWLSPTIAGMLAVDGQVEAEAGQTLLAALEPLARPASAGDHRSASQRRADALAELARRSLEGGRLPQTGGVRPQLTVTVDLDSVLDHHASLGGEAGWAEPLPAETARRLACDAAVTRVLVTRHSDNSSSHGGRTGDDGETGETGGLAARLRAAVALLPPVLGGGPTQPLEVGRTTRVVSAAQRAALSVRDGGCAFPGCDRSQAWCEAHHLRHWLHGGPTDLANLTLLCRTHHRAVHEGSWRLHRQTGGQLTATPPHRKHPTAA